VVNPEEERALHVIDLRACPDYVLELALVGGRRKKKRKKKKKIFRTLSALVRTAFLGCEALRWPVAFAIPFPFTQMSTSKR